MNPPSRVSELIRRSLQQVNSFLSRTTDSPDNYCLFLGLAMKSRPEQAAYYQDSAPPMSHPNKVAFPPLHLLPPKGITPASSTT